MERAGVTPLSSGPPAEGGPLAPMDRHLSLAKRPRPPSEAEQVRATQVAPHGPWHRPQHPQQPCMAPPMGDSRLQDSGGQYQTGKACTCTPLIGHWACLMAEPPLTLARAAPPRRRGPQPGGPYGHNSRTCCLTLQYITQLWPHRISMSAATPSRKMTPHHTSPRPFTPHSHQHATRLTP